MFFLQVEGNQRLDAVARGGKTELSFHVRRQRLDSTVEWNVLESTGNFGISREDGRSRPSEHA